MCALPLLNLKKKQRLLAVYIRATCSPGRFNSRHLSSPILISIIFAAFCKFMGSVNTEWTLHILEQLLKKLTEIEEWFKTQRLYRFIASSILISYEADCHQNVVGNFTPSNDRPSSFVCQDQSLTDTVIDSNVSPHLPSTSHQQLLNRTLVDARIIDTAHVFTTSDTDFNYLFGLENIILTINCVQKSFN